MTATLTPASVDEELRPPASSAERAAVLSYSLAKLCRIAAARPEVLDEIADDLAEAYLVVIPAVEHVELQLDDDEEARLEDEAHALNTAELHATAS